MSNIAPPDPEKLKALMEIVGRRDEGRLREVIREWNETAQVLHPGHIIDLAAKISEAV